MQDLILYIVKNIVSLPDEVSVSMVEDPESGKNIYELSVSDADRPYVIGKKGSTINAIRKLVLIKDHKAIVRIKE